MADRLGSGHGDWRSAASINIQRTPLSDLQEDTSKAAYMICELNAGSYAILSEELVQSFPPNAQSFLDSAAATILSRLNVTLSELDQRSGKISGVNVDECWRAVVLARPVLQEIAKLSQLTHRWTRLDVQGKPFADIGVEIPSDEEELARIAREVLEHQRDILKCYLALLRRPDIIEQVRRHFEDQSKHSNNQRSTHPKPHELMPDTAISRGTAASPEYNDSPSTHAPLRPAKALFYFETATGFGEWRVYISSSATTDLRKLRKRNPVLFEATVVKIRKLSHGDFSSDNHVLLSDTEGAVPIFKARIADDSRLVYSVDCVPDLDAEVDRQAIRIFGVYTHAQLYRRDNFWTALARDLGRQGEVYRDRCRQRSQPRNAGKQHAYTPITFPKLPERTTPDDYTFLLPTDSTESDATRLLSMHRVLILSKALLNSLLADLEVPFLAHPSPAETEIIEHNTSCFVIGRSGTGKTWTMIYKIVAIMRGWELWDSEQTKPRVMFVTRSSMLADQVHNTTIQLLDACRVGDLTEEELATVAEQRAQSTESLDGERRRCLPKKWSALEDQHFPLFITVEELYAMLEADFEPRTGAADRDELDVDIGDESLLSPVSGNRFVKMYWSHLPRSLIKDVDPMSVFSEFLGVIKGSEGTVGTKEGRLARAAYTSLSVRSYPTFASQRDKLYNLFEAYVRLASKRRECDGADRTHSLLRHLDSARMPGLLVEFLFVDEVQDNLIVDMLLFRSLCDNPNGLFWAGDTAQTIAVGSSFTFEELKSMLHRLERRQANPLQVPPSTFHLAVNYRSHSGITNCAQTVVDILTTVWPKSLDRLGPEHGWRAGPKPVFFGSSGMDQLTPFERQYTRTSKLQLGSGQCIIVRDEAAKDAFLSRGITSGLVLTIYQSKGLEFDDVFLYHLFGDSPVTQQQWRTLCEHTVSIVWAEGCRSICRELKMLYVALTRARQRLWIVDGSEKALPMMDFWARRDLVERNMLELEDAPLSLARPSSSEEWAKQGKHFMDKQEFDLAQQCFESAGIPLERDIAKAYLLQETADKASEYSSAAEALRSCAEMVSGERAKKLLLASAACHDRADDWVKSAAAFYEAGEFTKCVRQYIRARMMEDARHVILYHREEVNDSVLKRVYMHFFDNNEKSKAIELFTSVEEAIEFMKANKLYHALAPYLRELRRVREAAEVYLQDLHDVPNAVELYLLDPEDVNMVAEGTHAMLKDLWRCLPFGRKVDLHSQHAVLPRLLPLAYRRLSMDNISYDGNKGEEKELSLFVAIVEKDVEQLVHLGLQFSHSTKHDPLVALSLDFAFTFLLDERGPLEPDMVVSTPSLLPAFGVYTKVLTDHDNAAFWKAYGIRKISGKKVGLYSLPRASFLYDTAVALAVVGRTQNSFDELEGEADISSTAVIRVLRSDVGDRVRRRASIINAACQRLGIIRLCVLYAFTGHCPRSSHAPCTADHRSILSDLQLHEHGLHIRLRICAQTILIYEPLVYGSNDDAGKIWDARLHWMGLFLETIYVPFFELGSLLMFIPDRVPEFKDACRVLRSWICDILFAPRPHRSRTSAKIGGSLRHQAIPRAALLSYVLDRIDDHLRDATSYRQAMSTPPFLWYTASCKILTEKLTKYSREHEPSHYEMPGALLYLRFLLDRGETHFHRGIMAHLVQGLCSAFVLSDRGRARKSLHNLMLSRRWLVNLADLWTASHDVDWHDHGHVWELIGMFPPLLERLPVAEGDVTESKYSSNVMIDCLDTLCKALFYLGYWHSEFRHRDTKSRILDILMGIQKECPKPSYLYSIEKSDSTYWEALRKDIVWYRPLSSHGWDQLVQVKTAGDAEQGKPPGRVVRVIYDSLDDLLGLLDLPNKPYANTPFPKSWLQERNQGPRSPSPDVHAQDDASEQSQAARSAGPLETRKSLAVGEATLVVDDREDAEEVERGLPENDQQRKEL